MKAYIIECRTGCTCCSDDNHYRGPYKTHEDAQKRIDYFNHPNSKYWPISSQYSKRGNYFIHEYDVELISDNRAIINDRVYYDFEFIKSEDIELGNIDYLIDYYSF